MSNRAMPTVIEGHNDTLHLLHPFALSDVRRFLDGLPDGAIDLPKARHGQFGVGFFDPGR